MIKFITESIREITHEVTWPSQQELTKLSNLLLTSLAIITTLVGIINIYLQKISTWLYGTF